MDQDVPPQAADDGGLTEGLEGLPANRPCVYDAKLRTLQTLRQQQADLGCEGRDQR